MVAVHQLVFIPHVKETDLGFRPKGEGTVCMKSASLTTMDKRLLQLGLSSPILWVLRGPFILPQSPHGITAPLSTPQHSLAPAGLERADDVTLGMTGQAKERKGDRRSGEPARCFQRRSVR